MGKTEWALTVPSTLSPEDLWNRIKDFHSLMWANVPVEKVGEISGTTVGAERIVAGGPHETLREFDDEARRFVYTIDGFGGKNDVFEIICPPFTTDYKGVVQILPAEEGSTGCRISWSASWKNVKLEGDEVYDRVNSVLAGATQAAAALN
mmetsp:Transcript_16472/g.46454  ORF Transcript_16472/g.46454 Transcript_16472/m.46454 type:complete len:150 (+) Transcript_16472:58-507(+)|eukprot:CAMPEP_0119132510 /NCGR_PEP_ID=MMETSP1310-20130426/11875_1 /TAXON_ID=464262 /ORGANISM="Genus nov. species nov., Strain RCC2339" /LENGTH=149 /DNA_ID=CAMNT_0007123147 /DNA_START=58 /DNA_END=507 /DNA_ORIENTATION=+